MNKYLTYEADDFAMDDSFRRWVLENDAEQAKRWERWLTANPHKETEVEKARQALYAIAQERDVSTEQDFAEVWNKINSSLNEQRVKRLTSSIAVKWYYMAASVALAIAIGFGYWTIRQPEPSTFYSTDYGQTEEFTLPDGSKVLLNANSTLNFIGDWSNNDKNREVWLDGEGFFEVVHQNNQKFIVYTPEAAVEVLGTSFNVSNRREKTEVILETGKVAFYAGEEDILLEPGERVQYDPSTRELEKERVNTELKTSWRYNQYVFESTSLREIAQTLEDQYGFTVAFHGERIEALLFSGTIPTDQIDLLLQALQETHDITITQQYDTLVFQEK